MKPRLGPGTLELQRAQSILGRKLDERLESCEERDDTRGRERGWLWLEREPDVILGAPRAAAAWSPGGVGPARLQLLLPAPVALYSPQWPVIRGTGTRGQGTSHREHTTVRQ